MRHLVAALFVVAVFGSLSLAIQQLANRIPYEWDLFIWSESPFLTNMLKIDAGQSIYSSPEQVNSFVYSPGLEYLTYALLKPIGRHLDIRYCRLVSVGFAVLAALAFMRCTVLLGREAFPRIQSRWFPPVSAALFFLVIYHNFTSDVPHPDNLHIWHLAVTLLLTFEAIKWPSAWRAAAAVLFAAMAVLVKQTAALSAVGVAIALVSFAPRRLRAAAWLIPLAAAASMAALAGLWAMGEARFYTLEVLSSHGVQKEKLPLLYSYLFEEYRLLPLSLYVIALLSGLLSQNRALKRLLLAHFMIGVFEGVPALLAFLKPMGSWNNLAVIEAWATVPFVPLLLSALRPTESSELKPSRGSPLLNGLARVTIVVLSFGLVYCHLPSKDSPRQSHYDYCRKLEASIEADIKAGKRVLVAHGTSFLIRNQSRQIPRDRANSYLELWVAGKAGLMGTERRVREKYYDKIYLNSLWYGPYLYSVIFENYRVVGKIPAPIDRLTTQVAGPDYLMKFGFQPTIHLETPILEPQELPGVAIGARPSGHR